MPTGIIKKISVEQRWQVLWHIKKIPTTKKILSTQTLPWWKMTKQYIDIKSSQMKTKSTTIKNYFITYQTNHHYSDSIHGMFTNSYTSQNTEIHIFFSKTRLIKNIRSLNKFKKKKLPSHTIGKYFYT
jgi:hypothetical protein